jgi:hypothetical protein
MLPSSDKSPTKSDPLERHRPELSQESTPEHCSGEMELKSRPAFAAKTLNWTVKSRQPRNCRGAFLAKTAPNRLPSPKKTL